MVFGFYMRYTRLMGWLAAEPIQFFKLCIAAMLLLDDLAFLRPLLSHMQLIHLHINAEFLVS